MHEKTSFALGYGIVQPSLNPCRPSSLWLQRQPSRNALENPKNTESTLHLLNPLGIMTNNAQQLMSEGVYLVDEEYLVTALVPSETACLASSPGRMSRTDVWISREEMVDFLLYAASLDASVATRSKMSKTA